MFHYILDSILGFKSGVEHNREALICDCSKRWIIVASTSYCSYKLQFEMTNDGIHYC